MLMNVLRGLSWFATSRDCCPNVDNFCCRDSSRITSQTSLQRESPSMCPWTLVSQHLFNWFWNMQTWSIGKRFSFCIVTAWFYWASLFTHFVFCFRLRTLRTRTLHRRSFFPCHQHRCLAQGLAKTMKLHFLFDSHFLLQYLLFSLLFTSFGFDLALRWTRGNSGGTIFLHVLIIRALKTLMTFIDWFWYTLARDFIRCLAFSVCHTSFVSTCQGSPTSESLRHILPVQPTWAAQDLTWSWGDLCSDLKNLILHQSIHESSNDGEWWSSPAEAPENLTCRPPSLYLFLLNMLIILITPSTAFCKSALLLYPECIPPNAYILYILCIPYLKAQQVNTVSPPELLNLKPTCGPFLAWDEQGGFGQRDLEWTWDGAAFKLLFLY